MFLLILPIATVVETAWGEFEYVVNAYGPQLTAG
jgi:hypothetical protein